MDTLSLLHLCENDTKINRCFAGVLSCDQLPNKLSYPSCMIVNTKPSNTTGEHWISIFINKEGYGDYFCSYGVSPSSLFIDYMNKQTISWNYSRKCLQDSLSTTCGQYAVFFLHARANGLPLNKFLSLFTKDKEENDEIVTAYINGLYDVNTQIIDENFIDQSTSSWKHTSNSSFHSL